MGLAEGATEVMLALDAQGEPHLTYQDYNYLTQHALRVGSAFEAYYLGAFESPYLVNERGTVILVHNAVPSFYRSTFDKPDELSHTLFSGTGWVLAADTSSGDLYVATAYDRGSTISVGRAKDGTVDREPVWTKDDPRYIQEAFWASLVVSKDGTLRLVHTAPSGLVLHTIREGEASMVKLVSDNVAPLLVVGPDDEPHVLYYALDEIRHVFRGTCP